MLIIIDARIPEEVKSVLSEIGLVYEIKSEGIVYDSIKGHPDIFLFQMDELVILAPNAPLSLKEILKKERITFLRGKSKLSNKFPDTVFYNAVYTEHYLIHKKGLTDSCIIHEADKKEFIDVNQAYTRCNLLPLPDGSFITSDKSIEKALAEKGIEVHYFTSGDVLLEDQDHGFLGGCLGVLDHTIYMIGNLNFYKEGARLRQLFLSKNIKLVELYNGPLVDGGGLFFLRS
ncbi:MAG: hypothetical protein KAH25_06490 [Bacteroidales bacterium]|nr:hypothetical protein [Bacteroidales bacterium]